MNDESDIRTVVGQLVRFVKLAEIPWFMLLLPGFIGLLATFAEGVSLAFLYPLIQGLLEGNLNSVSNNPYGKKMLVLLPIWIRGDEFYLGLFFATTVACSRVAQILLVYCSLALSTRNNLRLKVAVKNSIFCRFLEFGQLYFDLNNIGYLQRVLGGYSSSITRIIFAFNSKLLSIFQLCIYLAIMSLISFPLTVAVLLIFPVLHLLVQPVVERIRSQARTAISQSNNEGRLVQNSLSIMDLVKVRSNEQYERARFAELLSELELTRLRLRLTEGLVAPIQQLTALLHLVLVVTVVIVLDRMGLSGTNLAGYTLFFIVLRRSSSLFNVFNQIRLMIANIRPPLEEVLKVFHDEDKFRIAEGSVIFESLEKRIEISDLNFSYKPGQKVLDSLSLYIDAGEKVAIVGKTGAGKSTLFHLLLRLYDSESETILCDGIDIRNLTLSSWRSKIALVQQDAVIFQGTLKDNLIYGIQEEIEDERLLKVVEKAQLQDVVNSWGEGLYSEIGSRGSTLSGGERQRISIARAFLLEPEIILLDEPTSSLDSHTEDLILKALEELCKDKTVVTIAHRLATVQKADRLIVMDKGRVVESGTLQDLLALDGAFKNFWDLQYLG